MTTDLDPRERSARMMADESAWPIYPRLPLKKRGSTELGYLLAPAVVPESVGVALIHGLIFEPLTTSTKWTRYPSIDALLDDGWVVD